jgi:RNA polymerase sigma factor (sigma-70 family)
MGEVGGRPPGKALRAAAAAPVLDRLPHARKRQRGRGRGPGGVRAVSRRKPRRRRLATRVLTTVTTRLAIDELRSARARREQYVGEWLPEPLVADTAEDAHQHAELVESLSMAFLVLLETPSPVERAVFLLHDVFDYPYAEIAAIVEKSEDTCRQIAARARRHVETRRPRFAASRAAGEEIGRRFLAATEEGDTAALIEPHRRRETRRRRRRRRQGAGDRTPGRGAPAGRRGGGGACKPGAADRP